MGQFMVVEPQIGCSIDFVENGCGKQRKVATPSLYRILARLVLVS